MEITGITITRIITHEIVNKDNTTEFYKFFMEYCIDNFSAEILVSMDLQRYFKISGEFPNFNRAIFYDRVIEYNGLFYTDWISSKQKKRNIEKISELLNLNTIISTIE